MDRILIVEDDLRIAELLRRFFEGEQFSVDVVADGHDAIRTILRGQPDLVVLDMMLPGIDGLEVCRQVRPEYIGPILMLTAKDDDLTEVAALNSGIDDYLSKPARPHVLLARVRALLRRVAQPAEVAEPVAEIQIQDLVLVHGSRIVLKGGEDLRLSESDFELLWFMASRAGDVVSRDALLSCLRGVEFDGVDRSVDMRISKLRRCLGDFRNPYRYIRTVRGKGYLFLEGSAS
jgi:DNA-binding response OmpR family regulator